MLRDELFESMRNGVIIDTGPLLLIAFYRFREGKYISKFRADIPDQDLKGVSETIQNIFSMVPRAVVTSYVLAEFHALAKREGVDGEGIISVVSDNFELFSKLEEIAIKKDDILNVKLQRALNFCFTDTSLMLAALETHMPILTIDKKLRNYCRMQSIPSLDLYYECYLS